MSWNTCQQKHIGATFSLVEGVENVQMKPGGIENRFLKNATESESSSSSRSNSPGSELFDHSTTSGSVASPSTVSTFPNADPHINEQFEQPFDSNLPYGVVHSCPHGFDIPESRIFPDSSLPDVVPDTAQNHSQTPRTHDIVDSRKNQVTNPKRLLGDGKSEETDSEFDDDLDSDDEEVYNDEWSGEPDKIESVVLANVEDLEFAAWLIADLTRDQIHSEAQKIGGWQKGILSCRGSSGSSGSGENQHHTPSGSHDDQASSNSRKRRRASESDDRWSDGGDGDEKDDGEGSGSPMNQDDGLTPGNPTRKYACPFNKVCESGCKSIQRVKEHIKRKHVIIQCERCFKSFSEKGRRKEDSVAELAKHRREPEPCALGNPLEANLGINMDQESLLNETRGKKRQKISDVDKWFNIWKVIFPNEPQPSHPWVDTTTTGRTQRPLSYHSQGYFNMVERSLQHHANLGLIQFLPGQEVEMMRRVLTMVRSLYHIHMDRNGTPSLVNTSSGGQTETQTIMPMTPLLETQSMNDPPQPVPGPKMNEHGSQPMLMPNLHAGSAPMNLDSQSPFGMIQPNAVNMAYAPQFNIFNNQLQRLSPSHMQPGPSGTLAGLTLEPADYGWAYENLNNWSGFQYPPQVDPDNPEM